MIILYILIIVFVYCKLYLYEISVNILKYLYILIIVFVYCKLYVVSVMYYINIYIYRVVIFFVYCILFVVESYVGGCGWKWGRGMLK